MLAILAADAWRWTMWLSFLLKLSFWRGRKILYLDCDVRYIRSWWFQWQLLTQRKEGMLLQRPLKAECRVVSFIAKPKFLLLYWNSDLRLLRFFFFLKQLKKPLREEVETKRTSRWVVFERLLLVLDSWIGIELRWRVKSDVYLLSKATRQFEQLKSFLLLLKVSRLAVKGIPKSTFHPPTPKHQDEVLDLKAYLDFDLVPYLLKRDC